MQQKKYIATTLNEFLNENLQIPDLVYHGSDNRSVSFNNKKPIFFVDDINIAKTYGDYIFSAKIDMDNPLEVDFDGKSTYYFYDKWYLPSQLAERTKEIADDIKMRYSLDDDLVEYLSSLDFSDLYGDLDGLIMRNISDPGARADMFVNLKPATNYIIFDKNQIKMLKRI